MTREEAVVQVLAALFIDQPSSCTAFAGLVARGIFTGLLRLGSAPRARLDARLLSTVFEPRLGSLIGGSDEIITAPFFWNADVMPLCSRARIASDYCTLNEATATGPDGEPVHLYSRLLALLLRLSSHHADGDVREIARRTKEVLDQFERNPDQQKFLLTILEVLDERSRACPADFAEVPLTILSEVAQNGVQTLSSVEGMALCERAMMTLLQGYIVQRKPIDWKTLFKEATNVAFMVKYMFREDLGIAKAKFQEAVGAPKSRLRGTSEDKEVLKQLVAETLASYGDVGIYDPKQLAEIDFLNKPELLVGLVDSSRHRQSRALKPDMQLLTEVTTKWMQLMVERSYPPLTPHHTEAFTVLMMCKFFAGYLRDADSTVAPKGKKRALKAFIAQLATGEGKSIVIAMLAIFMVRLFGMRVHVLENNAGLLQRDYEQNKPFYDKFGIKSSVSLDEDDAKIVYCLKDGINRRFLRKLVEGKLDEELGSTVLVVDEVDDLIVNERPNSHYVKRDAQRTPELAKCYAEIKVHGVYGTTQPDGIGDDVWGFANEVAKYAEARVEGKDYRIMESTAGTKHVIQLDASGNVPKVKLTSPWLMYLNYKLCAIEPFDETRHACVCTPYIFNKYKGIFGLTGSVGGKAELKYLASTYKAIKFDVPRFLDTCTGNARKEVTNHGVELLSGEAAQIERVCELATQNFRKVPVLVIATGAAQLSKIVHALREDGRVPSAEVQRFAQFDEKGRSLAKEWQTIIDDATRRLGGAEDSRCRVTVTDKFGGRGHDFQVVDKEANANGGMLVIATSIPDEREWIQWKGRTARQDRPGQFIVVLDETTPPFSEPAHKKLAGKLRKMIGAAKGGSAAGKDAGTGGGEEDAMIDLMLDVADDGIGEKLKAYEGEQATGEKLNELTEKYYKQNPRSFDAPWPHPDHMESDGLLRRILTNCTERKPSELREIAKAELDIHLE